ncbi:MAG: hypothetical protein C4339_03035 [Nitrososphaerota archaeon]
MSSQQARGRSQVWLVAGLVLGLIIGGAIAYPLGAAAAPKAPSERAIQLRLTLRELWVDHAFWAREAVLAAKTANSPAFDQAAQQLDANAQQLASALDQFYPGAGAQALSLLRDHIKFVVAYAVAALTGNSTGQSQAVQRMTANADAIASFLSQANPNWPRQAVSAALAGHVGLHKAQIDAITASDWARDATVWGQMLQNARAIADTLASGIVAQFPAKF